MPRRRQPGWVWQPPADPAGGASSLWLGPRQPSSAKSCFGEHGFSSGLSGHSSLKVALKPRDGELEVVVELCLACRAACDTRLAALRHESADVAAFRETISCVAVLTAVGDLLARDQDCPVSVLEYAIDLAGRLPRVGSGCWRACQAAAEALGDLIDSQYETG
jgi:hypothetical protein